MFKWLTKLFEGTTIPEVINDSVAQAPIAAPVKKTTTKKKTATKAEKIDLDSMSKTLLLDYAKANGIKANASLKKAELIKRIKNG